MAQHAEVRLAGGMTYLGRGASNHWLAMDTKPESGGLDGATRPVELLLIALGGCTGMDVISILRKKKQNVTEFRIELMGQQRDDNPKSYTSIELHFHVTGEEIDPAAVKRSIELSRDTFCSVAATLKPAVPLSYRYTIHSSQGEESYEL